MRLRWGCLAAGGAIASSCLVPPGFDGYEPAPASEGGTGDAALDAPGEADAADGEAEAGPLPGFGESCSPERGCADGLRCASEYGLVDVVVMSSQRWWTCVEPCTTEGTFCEPGGLLGLCLETLSDQGPACVRMCDATSPSLGCPDGSECWQFSGGEGFGFCVARCRSDADCTLLPLLRKCGLDGLCSVVSPPPDPTQRCSASSACLCHPVPTDGGTCRIACQSDADCPVHGPSGLQMVCPVTPGVMPTFANCEVPCQVPGPDPVCGAIGLRCSPDQPWAGAFTCG